MSEVLPEPMIAWLESFGTALVAIVREHRDASLATLEEETIETMRRALPGLLEEVLKLSTTSLQPPLSRWQQPCPSCGNLAGAQSWRNRKVSTICGHISFDRPWFVCPHCRHGFSPVDQTLGLRARKRLSEGLRQWVIRLGATTSFVEASFWLKELTGLKVSPETVRKQTEQRGDDIEKKEQLASERVSKTLEPPEIVDPAPGVLVVETDGVMVRYLDGWHEMKIGLE